ncbi:MAG TPA: HrpB1 family type III secretion system apparatus protein [Povalibacter sp.]|nr:HrpB1 family type III secretion system apparatus protein [Povalibacter sp.]
MVEATDVAKQALDFASAPARLRPRDPLLLERLAEVGFLASECGLHAHAERAFVCLSALRPGNPSPLIALAMVRARRGALTEAMTDLRALIAAQPDCDLARAMLATMIIHMRQAGALELLQTVLTTGSDPAAIEIARCWIDLAREHEQAPAPTVPAEFFRRHSIRS